MLATRATEARAARSLVDVNRIGMDETMKRPTTAELRDRVEGLTAWAESRLHWITWRLSEDPAAGGKLGQMERLRLVCERTTLTAVMDQLQGKV